MEASTKSKPIGTRALRFRRVIYAIGLAVSLFSGGCQAAAQGLPETVRGKAQVYDGVTFDLMEDGRRYRTATRIRLEAVDACKLRQKARYTDVDWPCGAVATAWLTSRTLVKVVECRPTRVLLGGRVSSTVLRRRNGHSSCGSRAGDVCPGCASW